MHAAARLILTTRKVKIKVKRYIIYNYAFVYFSAEESQYLDCGNSFVLLSKYFFPNTAQTQSANLQKKTI